MIAFSEWLNESKEILIDFKGLYSRGQNEGLMNYVDEIVSAESKRLKTIIDDELYIKFDKAEGFRISSYTDLPITVVKDSFIMEFHLELAYTEEKTEYSYDKESVLKQEKEFLNTLQYKYKITKIVEESNPGAKYIRIKKIINIEIPSILASFITMYNHINRGHNLKRDFGI